MNSEFKVAFSKAFAQSCGESIEDHCLDIISHYLDSKDNNNEDDCQAQRKNNDDSVVHQLQNLRLFPALKPALKSDVARDQFTLGVQRK